MGKRVISFELSEAGINAAIKEIEEYKRWLKDRLEELRRRFAEIIRENAEWGFNNALVTDAIGGNGDPDPTEVSVTMDYSKGDVTIVVAKGEQAFFIEFGAGIYFNGAAGSSPHPWGPEHGFLIGEYGKGFGKRRVWGYYNSNDELVLTHGTPAAMPMLRGLNEALANLDRLVREVFG